MDAKSGVGTIFNAMRLTRRSGRKSSYNVYVRLLHIEKKNKANVLNKIPAFQLNILTGNKPAVVRMNQVIPNTQLSPPPPPPGTSSEEEKCL
jgi:hypothetical protein